MSDTMPPKPASPLPWSCDGYPMGSVFEDVEERYGVAHEIPETADMRYIVWAANAAPVLFKALERLVGQRELGRHISGCSAIQWCDSGELPCDWSLCWCGAEEGLAALDEAKRALRVRERR